MKLEATRELFSRDTRYTLTITAADLEAVKLQPFDRALLRECGGADASIADRLLGLETLARRIEEVCS